MEIQQAVGATRNRSEEAIRFLREFVGELKSEGLTAAALHRAGRSEATTPPAGSARPGS
jgi:hypothetical protein